MDKAFITAIQTITHALDHALGMALICNNSFLINAKKAGSVIIA